MKTLARLGGILFVITSALQAEVDTEIPLGIEAVTGLRTSYVHRGFELADTSLDFQMQAEVTLSNETSVHLGFSHLAESNGDFSETSAYVELTHNLSKDLLAGTSLTYRDRNASLLSSGLDLGVFTSYALNHDWRWRNELNFDFGENGLYFASEVEWSHLISDRSFVTIEGGMSFVANYLERNGLNDFYARVSYTFTISDRVAITPFFGTSLQLDDHESDDVAYGGFWFEVIF
ncbi:MAG: hypothetical protein ACI9NQ_001018 [Paracoccaceae bacterium]|jgi:hypothetical protein